MKILKYAIVMFAILFVTGCAHTYGLTENWVDEDDLQQVLKTPEIQETAKQMGTPVFTEYRSDTVEFIYNYKPHLYKSTLDGREFKPNDKDRLDLWSVRTEFVGLLVLNGKVVGIRPRPDYQVAVNSTQAKSRIPWWIIALAIAAGLIIPIAVINS